MPEVEDESIEVQHLLAEPKTEHVSVDGALSLGKENSWKHTDLEKFSYGFDYIMKEDYGGFGPFNSQEQFELELGVLDGFLDEIDEVDDIHAANDISGACKDFLLDVELADKVSVLDYAPCVRSNLENSCSESQSPDFSGSSYAVMVLSESSIGTNSQSVGKICSLGNEVKSEVHYSSYDKWDTQAPAEQSTFHMSHDLEGLHEFDNDAKHLASAAPSDADENKVVQMGRQKRLRKPTKRFVEEFSDRKSKHAVEIEKSLSAASKGKRPRTGSHGKLCHAQDSKDRSSQMCTQSTFEDIEKLPDLKRLVIEKQRILSAAAKNKGLMWQERHLKALKSASRVGSFSETTIQTHFESQRQRGRPKKHLPRLCLESDNDDIASESEDDCVKKRRSKNSDRRKHQRMWTHPEVMKLVDGIAQYGTGRWTDIKKVMFSSSAYRTPVDLRDKWRNLLRASCAHKQKQSQIEVEEKLKHATRPLPKSILRRVRELASIHPYPRFSPGGRYVRRKKNAS
ncbi:hypothetical protein Tsubulata_010677 [Turnera subulata]|uniref:Uncharacterized protein n=1 Tax=Turnera subulata TaxID=218843 RepID=A0A9Q0GCM9_9ROSI|nr:hypothetical protein Tsubulata_010677 [Turnera subulata]